MPLSLEQANNDILRALLDAMPSAVFVVDADVHIREANRAAAELMHASETGPELPRAGEALHCLHAAEHSDGCGHSAVCGDCVIRGAVRDALAGSHRLRLRTRMPLRLDEGVQDAYFQITATRFHFQTEALVLLVLEDISEFAELRKIVPICAQCKKVRQDKDYWQTVESYVGRFMDLSFSHSYCPACKQDLLRAVDSTRVIPRQHQVKSNGR